MSHISNLLSNIQNAIIVRHHVVNVKRTKLNLEVLNLLQTQGFLDGIFLSNEKIGNISVFLKYSNDMPVLKKLKIISIPSKRVFVNYDTIVKHLVKQGLYVISTSEYGLICSNDYVQKTRLFHNVGGELLFQIIF